MLPVIFGIKRAATDGFGRVPAVCIAAGMGSGVLFLSRQRRAADPMIDLAMFGNRAFGGSLLANTVAMFALVGNAVFLTQYLQLTLGMSPLRAALWSLVPTIAVAGAAPLATALGRRSPAGERDGGRVCRGSVRLRRPDPTAADSPLAGHRRRGVTRRRAWSSS